MDKNDFTPDQRHYHGDLRSRRPQNQQRLLESDTTIKIRETSPNGTYISTHTLSSTTDTLTTQPAAALPTATASTSLLLRLLTPFLPTNYPHSVTADYTPYQIYDSIQAFASAIASLLASRAVLTSLGYGSESANSSATTLTLVSIVQNSIGQFATIFFAHYFALRIEAEVKFYRFLADIMNDAAFVLDVLSPSLPGYARVPTLCVASVCRSICGVCGGSTKAVLSAHFATAGNIGELNAKDGSQETVVNLVGMWFGGVVVSKVEGRNATLLWMFMLLAVHLWANYMAVRSIRLRALNRTRASMVLERLLTNKGDMNFETIGEEESLFGKGDQICISGEVLGVCKFGTLADLLTAFNLTMQAEKRDERRIGHLLDAFRNEQYVLWMDPKSRSCIVVLKEGGTPETEIRAWCHAIELACTIALRSRASKLVFDAVLQSLEGNQDMWEGFRAKIEGAGWDIASSNLAVNAGSRIHIQIAE